MKVRVPTRSPPQEFVETHLPYKPCLSKAIHLRSSADSLSTNIMLISLNSSLRFGVRLILSTSLMRHCGRRLRKRSGSSVLVSVVFIPP